MRITVQYFASLRELRGCAEEVLETEASSAGMLYGELQARYRFSTPARQMGIAVNDVYARPETPLREGDRVVFIPHVSGG